MKTIPILAAALVTGAAFSSPASIIFGTGNTQYDGVNFAADVNAMMITGQTVHGGLDVYFSNMIGPDGSTQVAMHAQHGAAFIESYADSLPGTHTGFSSLMITPQLHYAFTAGDFKLDELNGLTDGTVSFYVNGASIPTATLSLQSNGQNPYQFTTTDGDVVTAIVISVPTTALLADIKQVSVDMTAIVPEPSTMMAGVLLLLPFMATTLRALRGNRTA